MQEKGRHHHEFNDREKDFFPLSSDLFPQQLEDELVSVEQSVLEVGENRTDSPRANTLNNDQPTKRKFHDALSDVEEHRTITRASAENSLSYYIKDINKIPLLSAEEERELSRRTITGDITARNQLWEANLRLVIPFAKRYRGRGVLYLDLIQEGNMGLEEATQKFDYTRGFRFSTYAVWHIKRRLYHAVNQDPYIIHIPLYQVEQINKIKAASRAIYGETGCDASPEEIAAHIGIPREDVVDILEMPHSVASLEMLLEDDEDNTENYMDKAGFLADTRSTSPLPESSEEKKAIVEKKLGLLTPRQQQIVRLWYGLDDQELSKKQIAEVLQVGAENVQMLHNAAIRKMGGETPHRKKQ